MITNPVSGVRRGREPDGRTRFLLAAEEAALRDALQSETATGPGRPRKRGDLRPLFVASLHTGLRWSEQQRLTWADVDLLAGGLTVRQSKTDRSRSVPLNSIVAGVLLDLATARTRPDDPTEPVFRCTYTAPDRFFVRAVERAQTALRAAGVDASRLERATRGTATATRSPHGS